MDKLTKATLESCERHTAYEVRKAAVRYLDGDEDALNAVGLGRFKGKEEDAFRISEIAFLHMTAEDILHEHMEATKGDDE
jgi:hypothetical protein